jgi:PKD repeat protein
MKRYLTILILLPLLMAGCDREPYADAIINPNPAYVGEDISFTNISDNAESFEWSMGDGTTSTAYNVIHYYDDPGTYLVSLTAFGRKGGVSTATFEVDVIGSELRIIVKEFYDEYVVPNASVILYPTLTDWENETNPVGERYTNAVGECIFTGLSYQRYYVDVWEANHDNYTLAAEDWERYIQTQLLEPGFDQTYVAYVDYYETTKKSTSRSGQKKMMMQEERTAGSRELKPNKFSTPLEKK